MRVRELLNEEIAMERSVNNACSLTTCGTNATQGEKASEKNVKVKLDL
jgi:hypothetical protein